MKNILVRSALLLAIVLMAPLPAHTQPTKVFRIGVLEPSSFVTPGTPINSLWEAFRQGLRELGYVEGRNLVIEVRAAEGQYDRLPGLAAELVRLKPDVIVVDGTMAVVPARRATKTIPIVMAVAANPVESGLVFSLARPGGNITGSSFLSADLAGKRLALLKEAVPKARRVAILSNPDAPAHALILREGLGAALTLELLIQDLPVSTPPGLDDAFATALAHHADAIFVLDDPMFGSNGVRIVELAAQSRLPAMYGIRQFVDGGGLISYGPSLPDLFRRAATYVDKILKGAKPGDLPIEQPTKFELVVNLKTAKALGLAIPESILLRADEVIR
jgi:putative ABC transport system substrate-binding protein